MFDLKCGVSFQLAFFASQAGSLRHLFIERSQDRSLIRDPSLMDRSAAAISNYPGGHNEGFPGTFKQLFRSFYDYITRADFNASPPFPTFTDD